MTPPTTRPGRLPRLVAAGLVASATAVVFAALGGVGFAKTAISAAQYQYGQKVTLCHKPGTPAEHTITVAQAAVPAHLRHGDRLGPCSSQAKAKKAKAAKAKAAKAKAAKVKAAKAKAAKVKAAKAKVAKTKAEHAKAAKAKAEQAKAEKAKAQKSKGKGNKPAPAPTTTAPAEDDKNNKGKGKGRGK